MTQNTDQTALGTTVDRVALQLEAIETFMARRFDEISAEINATSQQVDMAEDGIVKRFAEILEVLSAISHSGDGITPANAGVELGAVVDTTEDAANQILDSASKIGNIVDKRDWTTESTRQEALNDIKKEVDEIFLACTFQDLTGQRIRKTLENLQMIEDRLGAALERLGITINLADHHNPALPDNIANQDDIDEMFG